MLCDRKISLVSILGLPKVPDKQQSGGICNASRKIDTIRIDSTIPRFRKDAHHNSPSIRTVLFRDCHFASCRHLSPRLCPTSSVETGFLRIGVSRQRLCFVRTACSVVHHGGCPSCAGPMASSCRDAHAQSADRTLSSSSSQLAGLPVRNRRGGLV